MAHQRRAAGLMVAASIASVGLLPQALASTASARSDGLRLIGAGLPATGTQSFTSVLQALGYRSTHGTHAMYSMTMRNAWQGYAQEGMPLAAGLQEVLARGYDATNDSPFVFAWKELAETFPEAKVILTVRDSAEKWYESLRTKDHKADNMHLFNMKLVCLWHGCDLDSYGTFLKGNQRLYGCDFQAEQTPELKRTCIQGYLDHIEEVKNTISAERLLVYNVKQGWGPLCEFLGVPEPDRPYPRLDITKNKANILDTISQAWTDMPDWMVEVFKPLMFFWGTVWLLVLTAVVCCCCGFVRCAWRVARSAPLLARRPGTHAKAD